MDSKKVITDFDKKRTELYHKLRENHLAFTDFVNKGKIDLKDMVAKRE